MQSFVDDVLSAWHKSSWSIAGPPDYTDFMHSYWDRRLAFCRRTPAYDYLVKCWQDREDPEPHRLANAVCPWRVSNRSWK